MPDSFDPNAVETISYPRKTANQQRETFYPADGNSVVALYVEVTPAQKAAVRADLLALAPWLGLQGGPVGAH